MGASALVENLQERCIHDFRRLVDEDVDRPRLLVSGLLEEEAKERKTFCEHLPGCFPDLNRRFRAFKVVSGAGHAGEIREEQCPDGRPHHWVGERIQPHVDDAVPCNEVIGIAPGILLLFLNRLRGREHVSQRARGEHGKNRQKRRAHL